MIRLERAVPDDAARCVQLRDDAARWLIARGIQQWGVGEIDPVDVRAAIGRGEVFVVRRAAALAATVTLTSRDLLVWGEADEVPARYVHRLITTRRQPGLGAAVLAAVEDRARGEGADVVRLDCVRSNTRLRQWYADQGYREVGQVTPAEPGWHPSTLFEKPLLAHFG